jgi:hypothetical protein
VCDVAAGRDQQGSRRRVTDGLSQQQQVVRQPRKQRQQQHGEESMEDAEGMVAGGDVQQAADAGAPTLRKQQQQPQVRSAGRKRAAVVGPDALAGARSGKQVRQDPVRGGRKGRVQDTRVTAAV